MFGVLNTSASGLVAQRVRLEAIASNVANMNTIDDGTGQPFRRRITLFAQGDPATGSEAGVHVKDILLDDKPFRKEWSPGHPADKDGDGYIEMPNINSAIETVNAMEAMRAYEANVTAAQATKQMMQAALKLLG